MAPFSTSAAASGNNVIATVNPLAIPVPAGVICKRLCFVKVGEKMIAYPHIEGIGEGVVYPATNFAPRDGSYYDCWLTPRNKQVGVKVGNRWEQRPLYMAVIDPNTVGKVSAEEAPAFITTKVSNLELLVEKEMKRGRRTWKFVLYRLKGGPVVRLPRGMRPLDLQKSVNHDVMLATGPELSYVLMGLDDRQPGPAWQILFDFANAGKTKPHGDLENPRRALVETMVAETNGAMPKEVATWRLSDLDGLVERVYARVGLSLHPAVKGRLLKAINERQTQTAVQASLEQDPNLPYPIPFTSITEVKDDKGIAITVDIRLQLPEVALGLLEIPNPLEQELSADDVLSEEEKAAGTVLDPETLQQRIDFKRLTDWHIMRNEVLAWRFREATPEGKLNADAIERATNRAHRAYYVVYKYHEDTLPHRTELTPEQRQQALQGMRLVERDLKRAAKILKDFYYERQILARAAAIAAGTLVIEPEPVVEPKESTPEPLSVEVTAPEATTTPVAVTVEPRPDPTPTQAEPQIDAATKKRHAETRNLLKKAKIGNPTQRTQFATHLDDVSGGESLDHLSQMDTDELERLVAQASGAMDEDAFDVDVCHQIIAAIRGD